MSSSKKRKSSEHHHSDCSPNSNQNLKMHCTSSKRFCNSHYRNELEPANESDLLQRLRDIIINEFHEETSLKLQQLERIEGLLSQAQFLLQRLRYAILSCFYKNKDVCLSHSDVARMCDSQILNEPEYNFSQTPLHPSIKRIIGKKPCNNSETSNISSRHTTVQNKNEVLEIKPLDLQEPRHKLKQLYRDELIVNPPTETKANNVEFILNEDTICSKPLVKTTGATFNTLHQPITLTKENYVTSSNDKKKYLIVVGNTSKYIGNDIKQSGPVSHKWLVYVQTKNKNVPLENLVKKVRFYLHHSYRPNDIVDICSPPFQLARRGWGEFPMRIKLFFHDHTQQKTVQVIHHLVLDKSHSGIHTLGAETLVAVWLRPSGGQAQLNTKANIRDSPQQIANCASKELVNNTLQDSANEIKEITKPNWFTKSPIYDAASVYNEERDNEENKSLILCKDNVLITDSSNSIHKNQSREETICFKHQGTTTSNANVVNVCQNSQATHEGHNLRASEGNLKNTISTSDNKKYIVNIPKKVPQQSVVQHKDESRQIKYLQTNLPGTINCVREGHHTTGSNTATDIPATSKAINTICKHTNTKFTNVGKTTKNFVFQRGGKLYIIDPLQTKLKQQQKEQISLLKPEVNMRKQTHILPAMLTVAQDHDYVLSPNSYSMFPTAYPRCQPKYVHEKIRPSNVREKCSASEIKQELKHEMHKFLKRYFAKTTPLNLGTVFKHALWRIPLVATRNNESANNLPFVHNTLKEFQLLSAVKQRACELLRARYILRLLQECKYLQQMHNTSQITFWSIREIIVFARLYCYTPELKKLPQLNSCSSIQPFPKIIKNEMSDHYSIQLNTLSMNTRITCWCDIMYQKLHRKNETYYSDEDVDVINSPKLNKKVDHFTNFGSDEKIELNYVCGADKLKHEKQFVVETYKNCHLRFDANEEAQLILGQSLHIFLENLLRRTIAMKRQDHSGSLTVNDSTINSRDLEQVITNNKELDFLTNNYLGAMKLNR